MGLFIENSLIPGEKIEFKANITWLSQLPLFIFALILIKTIVIPILFVTIAIINMLTTELVVTNKKVIGKTGFIRRVSIDLPLNRIESINIHQGIIGRILGYGKVAICGVGGNNVSIPFVKTPLNFRHVVMNLIDQKPTQ